MIKFLSFYCLTNFKKKRNDGLSGVCREMIYHRQVKDDSNHIREEKRNRLVIDAAEPGGVQQQQQEEPPDSPSSAVDTDPSTS